MKRAKLFREDLRPITIGTGSERRFLCMRPDSNGIGPARAGLARIIRTEANAAAAIRAVALYAYQGGGPDELTFVPGDVIDVSDSCYAKDMSDLSGVSDTNDS